MDLNLQKEEFSYAYIHAIAATAGYCFQLAPRPLDMDGIDGIIATPATSGSLRRPRLEIQVKCTSRDILTEQKVLFPLAVKNYDDLRYDDPYISRLLVVVVVSENPQNWLKHSETELCLQGCGYWISLRGQPATPNRTTVTISIPRQNLFNPPALITIMECLERGNLL
jgi:Domain of unknown function (DUF4365)